MKWFTEIGDTLEQNQKGYDKTMKRAANEHPLGMSCILRNKGSSQKEL